MNFIDHKIEEYAVASTTPEPAALLQLTRETNLKTYMPRMLSGHLQGRILSLFSKLVQPKLIVEVGTFTGYSATCLAEGLAEDGKLITFEISDEVAVLAQKHLHAAGISDKVEIRIGNAVELLKEIDAKIDLIFIDADKENYLAYWDILFPKLRRGGIMIADNVLWSGKVLDPENQHDEETRGLIAFTQKALSEKDAEQVLFPVRDGLLVIRKR
ncbi:MAG: O-methyltransferase [Bacteroidia bacterium]